MLKNAKTYLALDEEFDRQETELQEMRRARVEESEYSQREEVSLVSYSDSEAESIPCNGIEAVKHTEEADTSDLEEEAMLAHDNLHGITGGDREGPYSPPSPLNMEREEGDEPSTVPETPITPKAATAPLKEKTKKRPSPIKFPSGSPRVLHWLLHSPRKNSELSSRDLAPPVAAEAVPLGKEI
jgi:hypothetical protein